MSNCSYKNEMLKKKMKYYTTKDWTKETFEKSSHTSDKKQTAYSPEYWAEHPKSFLKESERDIKYVDYTPVGNKKAFFHIGHLTYPGIGEPTSLGNKTYLQYTIPFNTTPFLGANKIDTSTIDLETSLVNRRIGEPTNLKNGFRHHLTGQDWNRWHHVDKNVVQNSKNIIFADGIIPVGGISSRNQLQNYAQMNSH